MADAPNTVSTLSGLFKEQYASQIVNLVPDDVILQKELMFEQTDKLLGKTYNQPVLLTHEHGFTHAAPGSGAFTLNDAVAVTMQNASVDAYQILLKTQIDYETAAKASTGGKKAFASTVGLLAENMTLSTKKRVEVELMWGQAGLAVITGYASGTFVLTIATPEWAPGIWAGTEGMPIDIYAASGGSKKNTANCTITSVDIDARTITLSSGVTFTSNPAATDVIYYSGANGSEMAGMYKILANTGSLFGISAATYNLWKAASYANGSTTFLAAGMQKAIAKGAARGMSGDAIQLISVKTWADLMNDLAALRRFAENAAGGKGDYMIGAESVTLYSQNGKLEIKPYLYMKEGYSFGIVKDYWKRIGATDVTFKLPDRGDEFFIHLQSKAGYELRCYTDQALFCEAPCKNVLVTGITNST